MARYDLTGYNSQRTPEERKELASKAGKASAASRYKYRTQRDILRQIMTLKVPDKEKAARLEELGLEPTYANAILDAISSKASTGDVESARFVRDTIGEKPTESYNVGISAGEHIKSLDLNKLTDEELEALADQAD